MKKYLIILALLASMPLFADHVDPETARKVAATFLSNNDAKATQLTDLSKNAGFPNLYIFSTEESFVIVSASDCTKPIIGYSLTDGFQTENLSENKHYWLQSYNDEIQHVIDNQLRGTSEIDRQWEALAAGKTGYAKATTVVPPLIQTAWGQDTPYNDLCPSYLGDKAVTGCVATAMAQVMKYWNYPTRGTGSHDYHYNPYGDIAADFGNTLYDWNNMSNSYSSASSAEAQTAVATLMYHCGVSVEMKYGHSESSSNIKRSSIAMSTYFNYSALYLEKKNYSIDEWSDTLKNELDNGRPVLYAGTGATGGHAFVCDGYNNDGYFHFNWGWYGSSNEYYSLDLLNPGGSNYSSGQSAVINIHPMTDATIPIVLGNSSTTLNWTDSQNCGLYQIYRNDALIATTTEKTYTDPKPFYGSNKYYVRGSVDDHLTQPSNYAVVNIGFPSPTVDHLQAELTGNDIALSWEAPDWCYPSSANAASFSYVNEDRLDNNDSHYNWVDGPFVLSWGHRYPPESLTDFEGKVIHEISFFTMYPGAFDVIVYQGSEDDKPVTEIARQSITTARMGWSRVGFTKPVDIDCNKDLWVFVKNTDTKVHSVYHETITGNLNGSYFAGDDPTQTCSHALTDYTIWLIHAYLTDGTYTYNLYDGATKLNGGAPVADTSYTVIGPLGEGVHQYTVRTNQGGSETAASNVASVSVGDTELTTLALDGNNQMIIAPNSTLTITGVIDNDDPDNLIIEDGGQLVHPNHSAKANLKRSIIGYGNNTVKTGWYTIASPVANAPTDLATVDSYDLYAYDEPTHYWMNQKVATNNITDFKEGHGFLYANAANQSLSFAGNMKATNDNISITLSYTDSGVGLNGFNLVGNPFSRNLTYGDILLNDTILTVYYSVENGENFIVHRIDEDPIKPGMGFFIQANGENQQLEFNPTTKRNSNNDHSSFISIKVGNEQFTDRAFIQLGQGNTLRKMTISDDTPKVYLLSNNNDYSVMTITEPQGEIPVYFKASAQGHYTLSIENERSDFNYLHLVDNLTGSDIDLLKESSYSFEAKTSDYASRFRLLFNANPEAPALTDSIVDGDIQILDMTGRIVAYDRNAKLTPGIYILQTVNGNKTKTEKIIIK